MHVILITGSGVPIGNRRHPDYRSGTTYLKECFSRITAVSVRHPDEANRNAGKSLQFFSF